MAKEEKIKKDVVANLYWDSRVDATDIEVDVDDGEVTLKGMVPSYTAKNAAVEATWAIAGVQVVNNQLAVEYPTEITMPSDTVVKENIQSSLSWDSDIDSSDIDVTVMNNQVTLEGTVDSYWKKYRVEDLADVTGVYAITNKIAVVPTEKAKDEQIAEDVVGALTRNSNVREENIEVEVKDGKVTLRGTVSGQTELKAANESAYFTTGVTDVESVLKISV